MDINTPDKRTATFNSSKTTGPKVSINANPTAPAFHRSKVLTAKKFSNRSMLQDDDDIETDRGQENNGPVAMR